MDATEVKFTLTLPEVPEIHRLEAEKKAKEAYIMTLLRHGDISAGRAAELLEIGQWQLSDLMDSYKISPFPIQTKEELQQEVTQTLEILNQYKK
jgi:predicted HTH domain antitoxin